MTKDCGKLNGRLENEESERNSEASEPQENCPQKIHYDAVKAYCMCFNWYK